MRASPTRGRILLPSPPHRHNRQNRQRSHQPDQLIPMPLAQKPVVTSQHHPLVDRALCRRRQLQPSRYRHRRHTQPHRTPHPHPPASRQHRPQQQHSPKPIGGHQRMHHSRSRQSPATQQQSSPSIGPALFLHLKSRQQKLHRPHQRQQHTRSRHAPRRHIRIHQHQRSPRDGQRHPHRQQRHRSASRLPRPIAPSRQQPRGKQRQPEGRQMRQQKNHLHAEMRLAHQLGHHGRKK